jgi:hypothetical protein
MQRRQLGSAFFSPQAFTLFYAEVFAFGFDGVQNGNRLMPPISG